MADYNDFIGKKYSMLTCLDIVRVRGVKTKIKCVCDCGNIRNVDPHQLLIGRTKSCGCKKKDSMYKISKGVPNDYEFLGDVCRVLLKDGIYTTIDREDYDIISKYRWRISGAYSVTSPHRNEKSILMHRLIMGYSGDLCIDHINRNGLDNRKCNLRIATHQQNISNQGKKNGDFTSKYRGVYFFKDRNKYCARIKFNGNVSHIGYFNSEIVAAHAWNKKVSEMSNFIPINELPYSYEDLEKMLLLECLNKNR